jgi:hypothetical protein
LVYLQLQSLGIFDEKIKIKFRKVETFTK